jgi:hypothetical protein
MVKDKTNKQTNKQTNKNLTTNIPRSAKLKKSVKTFQCHGVTVEATGFLYTVYLVETNGTVLPLEDLVEKVKMSNTGGDYCNKVMGVSCGDGGEYDSSIPFVNQTPYGKWRMAGGRCGLGDFYDHNCSAGCKGSNKKFGGYVCR